MSGSIYKAGAGAILQQIRLDAYANNLANVNTTGFKADEPVFRFDAPDVPVDGSNGAVRLSPYALPLQYVTNFETGPVHATGRPLDVAIMGSGFLEVQTPSGIQYTRNGSLSINPEGKLSTAEGWPIMGQGGEITIEGGQVQINEAGEVTVDGNVAGALNVVDFKNPSRLSKTGNSLFKADDPAVGQMKAENYRVAQGELESSNVNAIRTMTDIIETLRVFEAYQKVIRAADDATAKTVNEVGTPA
jgi:flagellar basal-body rod protein FlgF